MLSNTKNSARNSRKTCNANWQSWFLNKNPIFYFIFKFTCFVSFFYLLSITPFFKNQIYFNCLAANAWCANGILYYLGQDSHLFGLNIISDCYGIAVSRGCDSIETSGFLTAAILAFQTDILKKSFGIFLGITFFIPLNLLRIVSLYLVGAYLPKCFDVVHQEIWPAIFIASAILIWVNWAKWVLQRTIGGRA